MSNNDKRKLLPIIGIRDEDDQPNPSRYNGYILVNRSDNEIFLSDGVSWNSISSQGGGGGVSTDAANTWTDTQTFDTATELKALDSEPSDPPTGYAEIYSKDKDINNQGIFAKYKIDGSIEEVELGVADDVLSLTELSDVTITTPSDEHVLIHNGTQFVNRALLAADLPASVPLLNTSNVFTAIQKIAVDNGQQLTFYRPVNTAGFGAGFYYNFNTSTDAEATYGFQYIGVEDNTNGSHRGDFYVQLARAGSLGISLRVYTGGNGGIIFGNNSRIQIDEGGLTAARVYTLPDSDQTLVGRTGTATLTNKTISGSSNTLSNIPDSALSANIPLKNTANTFTAANTLSTSANYPLITHRTTNTAADEVGGISFSGNNASGTATQYGGITTSIVANTAGTESGQLKFQTRFGGVFGNAMVLTHAGIAFIGRNLRLGLSETGLTAQRTFTFPDASTKLVGVDSETSLTFNQIAAASVSTPASGKITLFMNSSDGKLSVKDSAGSVTALY